ncbi:LysE family translocator [Aureibaculum luteum]|uniref:LysE family translocator n=1 Tax=Aureibaculum luteum TaxID=1548456 RepID=UPI000E47AEC8|nr:LysE family translocator [Aureibaculum luteum]
MDIILSFIAATALLAIAPGPDNIYVLITSIADGVKYGLATVFGLISGCIIHTTLVALGVSTIIKDNENLFLALKIFGASYLMFLAYKVYKSSSNINLTTDVKVEKSMFQLFKRGFIMNVLNPKVSIFFLAFFPSFLFSKELSTVIQFFILGFIFMAVSLIVFSVIAILSGQIAKGLNQNKNMGRFLKWLQIIVFVGIAIFILFS